MMFYFQGGDGLTGLSRQTKSFLVDPTSRFNRRANLGRLLHTRFISAKFLKKWLDSLNSPGTDLANVSNFIDLAHSVHSIADLFDRKLIYVLVSVSLVDCLSSPKLFLSKYVDFLSSFSNCQKSLSVGR
jgi:hypothetical protein